MRRLTRNELHSCDFYILLFFFLAFIGWLWEGCLYIFLAGHFVNRGMYYGPYLPIYGVGGILLYILLNKLSRRPIVTFLLAMGICSGIEYITSWVMELKWGIRWWDYSDEFCNINGRICLVGAILFGLGGVGLNCYLMPFFMKCYHKIDFKYRFIISIVLILIFVMDASFCTFMPHVGDNVAH